MKTDHHSEFVRLTDGRTYKEIAAALGVSWAAVRAWRASRRSAVARPVSEAIIRLARATYAPTT